MKAVKCCLVFCLVIRSVVWSWECGDDKPSNESFALMKKFCSDKGIIKGRGCETSDNVTVGLDLSSCGISSLTLSKKEESQLNKLEWIAINNNSLTLNESVAQLRSTALHYVVVSMSDECRNFNNETIHGNVKLCSEPVNICSDKTKKHCPENSNCGFDGPGLFTCDCAKDWQSYKCLKQKGFPYEKWLISIAVATIVFIVVIRLLQHADLKKGREFKELARQSNTDFGNPEDEGGIFD